MEYKLHDPAQGFIIRSINSMIAQGFIIWSINSMIPHRDL